MKNSFWLWHSQISWKCQENSSRFPAKLQNHSTAQAKKDVERSSGPIFLGRGSPDEVISHPVQLHVKTLHFWVLHPVPGEAVPVIDSCHHKKLESFLTWRGNLCWNNLCVPSLPPHPHLLHVSPCEGRGTVLFPAGKCSASNGAIPFFHQASTEAFREALWFLPPCRSSCGGDDPTRAGSTVWSPLNVLPCHCQPHRDGRGLFLCHSAPSARRTSGTSGPPELRQRWDRTQKQEYVVSSCRYSQRVRGCLGSVTSEESGCCSMWALSWLCIDLALYIHVVILIHCHFNA